MAKFSGIFLLILYLLNDVMSSDLILSEQQDISDDSTPTKLAENEQIDGDLFEATDEWKEIKPGQRVSSGLHYRINLETGKKEAKKMTMEEKTKESLGRIKDDPEAQSEEHHFNPLSKEDKLKTNDDIVTIKYLMGNYANGTNAQKLNILEDLEYFMHQIDNANDFINIHGIEDLILPILKNEKSKEILDKTCLILGAILQNNPEGKIRILERNNGLMELVLNSVNSHDVDSTIRQRNVYVLSTWLRNHKTSLEYFIASLNGFESLLESTFRKKSGLKLRLKLLKLYSDLIQDDKNEDLYSASASFSKLNPTTYCPLVLEIFFEDTSLGLARDLIDILMGFVRIPHCKNMFMRSEPLMSELMTLSMLRKHDDLVNDVNSLITVINDKIKKEL